ncbi:MAG TPA: zf-HC2 domain-containing protein [Blastocatellia bacterium]|nr:zf-HC2 domain-containing protein [Blastocatellia bacterium]
MNCRRIQSLIPLYVEGDLKAGKARQVRSHLEECSGCARVSSEYQDSQQWLRSYTPPDFESDFFDGLRSGVLREIEAGEIEASRPRRSWFHTFGPRFALNSTSLALASLVVFAALVGLALYAYPSMGSDEVPPSYLRGDAGAPLVPGLDARAPSEIDWRLPDPKPRPPRPAPKSEAARDSGPAREGRIALATPGESPSAPPSPVAVGGEPLRKVLRIELQTGDPNIRIIWFAPSEPNAEDSKLIINAETE